MVRPQKRVRQTAGSRSGKTTSTNIPVSQAFTIRNSTKASVHREQASEIIGYIGVGPNIPINIPISFYMNPLRMNGTRINRLASTFQKFRFKYARLRVVSNLPTTITGMLATGYAENPEQAIPSGADIVNSIYSLANGTITALYTPVYTDAVFKDTNRWYNIDDDSEEVMMTTQGKFVLTVAFAASLTSAQTLPVVLDYEIEFMGAAMQIESTNPVVQFPACLIGEKTTTGGAWGNALTPKSG